MDELKDEEFMELATEKGKIASALNHAIEEINQDRMEHSQEPDLLWYWLVRDETDDRIVIEIRKIYAEAEEEKAEDLEPHIESLMKPELSKLSITKPIQSTEVEVKPPIEVIPTEVEPKIDKEESAKTGKRTYNRLKDCTPLGRTNTVTIYKEIVDRIAVLFEQGEPDSIKSVAEIIGDYYTQIKYKSLEVYSYDYLKYMREHDLMPKPEPKLVAVRDADVRGSNPCHHPRCLPDADRRVSQMALEPKSLTSPPDVGSVELKERPKMPEGSEIPPELITLCSKLPDEFTWMHCRNEIEKIFGKSKLVSTTNSMIRLCKVYGLLMETEAGTFKKKGKD